MLDPPQGTPRILQHEKLPLITLKNKEMQNVGFFLSLISDFRSNKKKEFKQSLILAIF